MRWRATMLAGGMVAAVTGCGVEKGGKHGGGADRGTPPTVTSNAAAALVALDGAANEPTHEQLEALMRARRWPEAWDVANALIRLKPEDEELQFNAGYVASELGKTNEAMGHYQACVRIVPEYAEAHNNLGNLLRKAGHPADAIRHFEEAIQHAPENASAHNNLGTTLAMTGRVDEAIPHFMKATQLRTDYAEAWLNLGNAYMQQDRLLDAREPLQRALQIQPRHPAVLRAVARLQQKLP